ncbi:MAG TPA: isopentenyl-diphosphate Delta-isomerase [Bacteroidia bacterium]|nr:isopentenyl-diphosphate Delta-isomerase [Sphingobacteriales bacterium]HPD66238.1 isopentenyl-diphosphate Delta-isomerase [Bacteroidia bacterium]HRS59913.1 isopentenyl-diphosphate Delta-isomerase [Bacteroidia bacterium]HRU69387.1 isopentenyl-diphosphate Delta-isomerase [Bacteroidia bacterium]
MRDKVVLVDKNDREVGIMDKMEAHRKGILHRAFSVFIFNESNELLLQQRALSKYHSPGLWTNTCCSHPQAGEDVRFSAKSRLVEEMGFSCEIEKQFEFIYHAGVGDGLIEHELDHVFTGYYNHDPKPEPSEVADFKWIEINQLLKDVSEKPEKFTVWFRIILEQYIRFLNLKK